MKNIILSFILLSYSIVFAQGVPILKPEIGKEYNFTVKQKYWSKCDSLLKMPHKEDTYTKEQRDYLQNKCNEIGYGEIYDNVWSVVKYDDWLYEGFLVSKPKIDENGKKIYDFITTSSTLKSAKSNTYNAINICDLSYETAWVEGVNGYGIGETIEFKYPPNNDITAIKIANGYVKDKRTWSNNSRAKQLKVYRNNIPFAILNLEDVYAEQTFKIPALELKNLEFDCITFEIMNVYEGDKYDDTAISEIYFKVKQ